MRQLPLHHLGAVGRREDVQEVRQVGVASGPVGDARRVGRAAVAARDEILAEAPHLVGHAARHVVAAQQQVPPARRIACRLRLGGQHGARPPRALVHAAERAAGPALRTRLPTRRALATEGPQRLAPARALAGARHARGAQHAARGVQAVGLQRRTALAAGAGRGAGRRRRGKEREDEEQEGWSCHGGGDGTPSRSRPARRRGAIKKSASAALGARSLLA